MGVTEPSRRREAVRRRVLAALTVFLLCLGVFTPALPASDVYFSPTGGARQRLLAAIRSAKESIDVAVYHITSFELADALAAAKARGVRIRILTDGEKLQASGGAYRILERHRIPVRALGSAADGLMHHKFAVFDGKLVATGSYNWTQTAERGNYENLVFLDDPATVSRFATEFRRLWQSAGG
jgi:phosphatidylserine/phosphatidylglycerophosphate/cardiolipin synthase-like enzyme